MVALLEVQAVSKRYRDTAALEDVSFTLEPATVLALIGANGAGKTTLIKCVLGLVRFEGRVLVGGHDVARDGARARRAIDLCAAEDGLWLQEEGGSEPRRWMVPRPLWNRL